MTTESILCTNKQNSSIKQINSYPVYIKVHLTDFDKPLIVLYFHDEIYCHIAKTTDEF